MTVSNEVFDVEAVREQFPALGRKWNGRRVVYLDGPGGSQVARGAIGAMTRYMAEGGAKYLQPEIEPLRLPVSSGHSGSPA